MSTQVQHRRGTAVQHEAFTGAMSEITHDTTGNNLRVHDGAKIGGYRTLMEQELGVAGGIATLDSTGNVPEAQLGNVPKSYDYASTAALAAAEVPATITYVRTAGYSAVGDGGEALYKRVTSEPSHTGKVQSADGAWWEVAPLSGAINLRAFGAKGDGVTDDTSAVSSWLDYAILKQVEAFAPSGKFRCTTAVSKTFAGISHLSIRGVSSELTSFVFEGGGTSIDGFSFVAEAGNWWIDVSPGTGMQFQGLSIVTTNSNAGTGLLINSGSVEGRPQRKNRFADVSFRGKSGFAQNWGIQTDLLDAGSTWFDDCRWIMGGPGNLSGIGVRIRSSDETTDPTAIYFKHCQALYGNYWIKPEENVEGIYITQCDHVGGNVAVYMDVGSESGLHIVGGHYSNYAYNCFLDGTFDFTLTSALLYLSNDNASGTMYGVNLNNGARGTIANNIFVGNGIGTKVGVVVSNSPSSAQYGTTISGNQFCNLNIDVLLAATSQYVTVNPNGHSGTTSYPVQNSGTNNTVVAVVNKTGLYQASVVLTTTGGSVNTLNFPIPAGIFNVKPRIVQVTAVDQPIQGNYMYSAAGSTATNAVVELRSLTGTLPSGSVRFQISAWA